MDTNLTSIVEDRWREAVASPTAARWRSLSAVSAQIADAIEHSDPDNLMVVTHRAVYEEAYKRYLAMLPKAVQA